MILTLPTYPVPVIITLRVNKNNKKEYLIT